MLLAAVEIRAINKPIYWHLIDRAMKMMESAGYRVTEHNPDQNDPIGAWMSDARTFLLQAQDSARPEAQRGSDDLIYVPGLLRCKKCRFELVKTVLYVNAGTAGADNSPDTCPNDGSPMWRVSEREYREQLFDQLLTTRNDTIDFAARVCRELIVRMNARGRLQARAILEDCAKELEGRKVPSSLEPQKEGG